MQFQIPQFIDIEDKIIGPLTLKQFLYLAAAGGLSFMFFFLFQFWLWLLATIVLAIFSVSLAFVKYNGQPLPKIAWRALLFFWQPRMYVWQRESTYRTMALEGERGLLSGGMSSVKKLWQDLMTTKTPIPKREKVLQLAAMRRSTNDRFQAFRKLTGEREIARRVDYR